MKILTANRLTDGVVVFMHADGNWIRDVSFAAVFGSDDVDERLAAAARDVDRNLVIGVEAVDAVEDGPVSPKKLRERIRAFGPTIDYRATGKKSANVRVAA